MIDANEPLYSDENIIHIIKCAHTIEELESKFADYVGTKYAVACSSGSAAMHMAVLACGIRPDDKVIVSPLVDFSTISAIIISGAYPSFSDVDDYCNLNPKVLKQNITSEDKGIIINHSFGHPCQIDFLTEIGNEFEIPIIEDCRDSLGARVKDRMVGTFGDVSCFSFSSTGVIEGGMIATTREDIYRKCKKLRNHGLSEKTHINSFIGFNYKMSKLSARIAYHYIATHSKLLEKIINNSEYLSNNITSKYIKLLNSRYKLTSYKNSFGWFPVLLPSKSMCFRFQSYLTKHNIKFKYQHFNLISSQPALLKYNFYTNENLDNANNLVGRFIGIPNHYNLSQENLDEIINHLNNFDPIGDYNDNSSESENDINSK